MTGNVALFLFCAVLCATSTVGVRKLASRLRYVAAPNRDVPTHIRPVPVLGGVAIIIGTLPGLALATAQDSRWVGFAIGGGLLLVLGAYKDKLQREFFRPELQLCVQCVALGALVIGGLGFQLTHVPMIDGLLTLAVGLCLINGVNFLDVADGLAAGTCAISALFFAAALSGGAMLLALALSGACLGFLVHNRPRATIFMGDSGSFALGFALTALVVAAANETRGPGLPGAALVVALPVLEFVVTPLRRVVGGNNPLRGGRDHLALILLHRGWSNWQLLGMAWALGLVSGCVGSGVLDVFNAQGR